MGLGSLQTGELSVRWQVTPCGPIMAGGVLPLALWWVSYEELRKHLVVSEYAKHALSSDNSNSTKHYVCYTIQHF